MDRQKFKARHILIGLIISTCILILSAANLQLVDRSYRTKAESTTIGEKVQYPSRGLLRDRYGKLLVRNEPIYDILVVYNQVSPNMDTAAFCQLLDMKSDEFVRRMNKDFKLPQFSRNVPFIFKARLDATSAAPFLERYHEFPGFEYRVRSRRVYMQPYGAHVIGYMSEVNQDQINEHPEAYELGDYIGASGLEAQYESSLRGAKGVNYVMKDNIGRIVESMQGGDLDTPAVKGRDIVSTLDIDLQAYGELLMKGRRGAIVAIEPATGEVLASISAPSYDPNILAIGSGRGEAFRSMLQDSSRPMLNRALMSRYPPGSLFKPILALIALQMEIISPSEYVTCHGGYTYNNTTWKCHAGGGVNNLTTALSRSCNTYFYVTYKNMIEIAGFRNPSVGLDSLNYYLNAFGLGHKLMVDLPVENGGFIPTPEFYKNLYAEEGGRWYATYTISNGIGQGELELTTLQMANLAVIMANRGFYYQPHFFRSFDDQHHFEDRLEPSKHVVPIDPIHFEPVIEGMRRSITMGTGIAAAVPGIDICGKTGTSENVHGQDHSVFFAFAPKDDPKIAIAVYVENAGWGGSYAAPIASLMIEKYLRGEISERRQWVENRLVGSPKSVEPTTSSNAAAPTNQY